MVSSDKNQISPIQQTNQIVAKIEINSLKAYQNNTNSGLWPRLLAGNIDLTLQLPVYYLIGILTESNSITYICCGLFSYIYESSFQYTRWKGTPGKHLSNLQIIYNNENSGLRPWIRSAFKLAATSILPINMIMIAMHPKHKSLHDLIARSSVIFKPNR